MANLRILASPFLLACCIVLLALTAWAGESKTAAQRGYRLLGEKPYLPPDFDQETFDEVWKTWPEPLRTKAEKATLPERRKMAFARYGLSERPGDDSGKPLQYVVDDQGQWTMSCFSCHGGKVAGRVIPGLPNSHFALQTLTEEIRMTKLRLGKPLSSMDIGSVFIPLGKSRGTTNSVMFGVALMAFRDAELNFHGNRRPPRMVHHDMDAPPWWHFRKHNRLYIDGFAEKGSRPLMQFMLVRSNGPKKFHQWESDFRDVYAYLESIQPPKYPFAIDDSLAKTGKIVFERNCAQCHGTYGSRETYPEKLVSIEELGTDRVRLDALSAKYRTAYGQSWFAHFGEKKVIANPGGYVAPPLDGIWASGPYFHNGSVPTLWHVLHPDQRPVVWRRSEDGYDRNKVGLEIESFPRLPETITEVKELREYFNTQAFGKSAAGHLFPEALSKDEKHAVLEYLKTL